MPHWDVLVIGGGTAGLTAARLTARAGKRVLLVERDRPGGDCLWSGCVPTKALLEAARRFHEARHAEALGIQAPGASFDFAAIRAHIAESQRTAGKPDSEEAIRAAGVSFVRGEATFTDPHAVTVSGIRHTADAIVIATGSQPFIPDIPGLRESSPDTNVELLDWQDLPGSLAVIGAGAIGLEFGQALARLGVRVTIIEAASRILGNEEASSSEMIASVLRREGVTVRASAHVQHVARTASGFGIELSSPDGSEEVVSDRLVVATGRHPRIAELDLERADVAFSERGIEVDALLRTSQPHIFAAGDVTGGYQFTHVAEAQGRLIAGVINGSRLSRFQRWSDRVVPRVTYTDPEVASVGLTEEQARTCRKGIRSWEVPLSEVDRAIVMGQTDGFVKLVTAGGWQRWLPGLASVVGDEIVGATIIGPHAGDLLMPVVNAMKLRLPIGLVAWSMQAYPTLALGVRQAAGLPFS